MTRRTSGFTLIEVIGALVVFSVGVLMVLQVSGGLGRQMRWSAARAHLAVLASEKIDSLAQLSLGSIAAGVTVDTVDVQGLAYQRSLTVTRLTPILSRVDVALSPSGVDGPSHAVTGYVSDSW